MQSHQTCFMMDRVNPRTLQDKVHACGKEKPTMAKLNRAESTLDKQTPLEIYRMNYTGLLMITQRANWEFNDAKCHGCIIYLLVFLFCIYLFFSHSVFTFFVFLCHSLIQQLRN